MTDNFNESWLWVIVPLVISAIARYGKNQYHRFIKEGMREQFRMMQERDKRQRQLNEAERTSAYESEDEDA